MTSVLVWIMSSESRKGSFFEMLFRHFIISYAYTEGGRLVQDNLKGEYPDIIRSDNDAFVWSLFLRNAMPPYKMLPRTSRIVALCSLANFINAADRVIMPITIIPMTEEFKWSLQWQGWILSAFAFGYFTSQVTMIKKFFLPTVFFDKFFFTEATKTTEHGVKNCTLTRFLERALRADSEGKRFCCSPYSCGPSLLQLLRF
ncbi:unnamed protein product [Nesidiocoris tenuis]|uniref:Major facilitator superfamily (MFS) profile domain-containing protein n=1 Tax=Nesidiocoris tenuis TaxID=355587 RepID=A0A6H5G755_9HEMI|nr:unnamed protein product [Nesidiocoris tenuis]